MYFATNLSYLRNKKNMTQKDVSELIGTCQQTIGHYECGYREPHIKNLLKLAQFFGVTVDDLISKDLRPSHSILTSNLKYLRKKAGYTQTDMAQLLGYKGKSSLSLIENESAELSIDRLLNISDFFGVSVDDLLKKDLSKGGNKNADSGQKDSQ